jgi:hypothetical protein
MKLRVYYEVVLYFLDKHLPYRGEDGVILGKI